MTDSATPEPDSDPNSQSSSNRGEGRRSKVQRIIDERGFDDFGKELERQWTADDEDRASLRELADEFNRRVLADEAASSDMQLLEGELENFYAKLTDDDVASETRVAVERRFAREGINTEETLSDFVTHQAIHSYLTAYRGASMSTPDPETRLTNRRDTVNRLQTRLSNVVSETLQTLDRTGSITVGTADVFVNVSVSCEDCGSQKEFNVLLDEEGCDCQE